MGLLDWIIGWFFFTQYGLCCGAFLAGAFCFVLFLPQTGSVVQLPRSFFMIFYVTFSQMGICCQQIDFWTIVFEK